MTWHPLVPREIVVEGLPMMVWMCQIVQKSYQSKMVLFWK